MSTLRVIGAACLLGALVASPGRATPLDLDDPTPRWIEVRFEVSPEDEPGSLDRRWSPPRRARLRSLPGTGLVEIRVPATEVEAQLRSTGADPVAGSFSDFVWRLEPATGHVRRAALTGRVREPIRLGPLEIAAAVAISVDMSTERPAGFAPDRGPLGLRLQRYCAPETAIRGCFGVAPVRFDPARGYVNAVGALRAAHALADVRTFSPLGEVEFRERGGETPENILSGSSGGEALCSRGAGGPCSPAHGGES